MDVGQGLLPQGRIAVPGKRIGVTVGAVRMDIVKADFVKGQAVSLIFIYILIIIVN